MGLALDKLGTTYPPTTATIDGAQAAAYAAATNDPNPAFASGAFAPPVFGVVPTWDQLTAVSVDVIPSEALMLIVHGEQDMHFHRPLVPGVELSTAATVHSVRVGGSGTRLVVQADSTDAADGAAVLTQYVTMFVRGMSDGESGGPDKPAHDLADDARTQPVGAPFVVHVDDDQTYRYRDASGDQMPIHVDDGFARSVGLPGIIAHGLCTMAMCSQAVLATVGDGDPARLRRLAVRFAANVLPGNDVEVQLFDAGPVEGGHAYGFEATSAGAVVIKHGRAELSDPA